jgi:hypothetical protein
MLRNDICFFRGMMGDQKEFSTIVFLFAMVTLLGSPVSSFVLPRVTRTDNAIIIDCNLNYLI